MFLKTTYIRSTIVLLVLYVNSMNCQSSTMSSTSTGSGCQSCHYETIWLDVIYVMDSSAAAGSAIDDMWGLVQSTSEFYNIQKTGYTASNFSMRVGIVTYSYNATLVAALGNITTEEMYEIYLDSDGSPENNLESGLQMAIDQFNSSAHRLNCRKVIVVMASTYDPSGVNAPQKLADTFKASGGIIIAYDYFPEHGLPSTDLQQIASEGYFIYSRQSTMNTLMDALCDVNCFCPVNFISMSDNTRKVPQEGCYYPVPIQGNYAAASLNCDKNYNSILSTDKYVNKTSFLLETISYRDLLLGLKYSSSDNQWIWEDGTTLDDNYNNWIDGIPPSGDLQCVYLDGKSSKWTSTNCRNGYDYVCQRIPCDTFNYCTENV